MNITINKTLKNIRHDYTKGELVEENVASNPIIQFNYWLQEAFDMKDETANAFVLSTVNTQSQPSSRVLLLRECTEEGFSFFTNYQSHKGQELSGCSKASMLFFWKELQRQVRIEGYVVKLSEQECEAYFQSRPRESQIAALASQQSTVIANRKELEDKFIELQKVYEGHLIPKPEHWGGYMLRPTKLEFWQGRASRMHDRILFTLNHSDWKIERLSP